jgi:hypothetical protein
MDGESGQFPIMMGILPGINTKSKWGKKWLRHYLEIL